MMSSEDDSRLIELLDLCSPGDLTPGVFEAVARVAVYPAIELIPYKAKQGSLSVGLLRRPEDDNFWPSMWHIPGTVFRPTDTGFEDAFNRLRSDEFTWPSGASPYLISVNIVPYRRGTGLTVEYAVDVTDGDSTGDLTFFDIKNLPNDIIEEQIPIINRFVDFYNNTSSNTR